MTELGYDASDLDARLASIDRKLREIQAGLAPEHAPEVAEEEEARAASADEDASGPPEDSAAMAPEEPVAPTEPAEPLPAPEAIDRAEALEPTEPPEPPEPPGQPHEIHPRGREGPLATLLQQARREPPPPAHPAVQQRLARQVEELTEMHVGLLSSIVGAIDELQRAFANMPRVGATGLTVSAGPFMTTEAVRAFESELASLRGVREVTLRGYEGEDRAVIDVELSSPTP
jgi:hypothetical protein